LFTKDKDNPFNLYYILNYNNNELFFNDIEIINKKDGLKVFIENKKIKQLDKYEYDYYIKDSN